MFRFSIDRGGTFTDIYAEVPADPPFRVLKLLSVDPENYPDAPREGIRRILEEVTKIPHPKEKPLDTSRIQWIRMGTTVATNALLEREGAKTALLITKGFKDVLHIGNQSRPKIFDLKVEMPENLYSHVVEIDERVMLLREGSTIPHQSWEGGAMEGMDMNDGEIVVGSTGQSVRVIKKLNLEVVKNQLLELKQMGVRSIAIVLMHAYTFDKHEHQVHQLCNELQFDHVTSSSKAIKMAKLVGRGSTACADAYLTPCISNYLKSFAKGFDEGLMNRVKLLFMQSDGGLSQASDFSGCRAILSGPAGGVVGYALTTYSDHTKEGVIGFDMGGTSTDVSRYAGRLEHVFETSTAGVSIQAPQLDINTVAAGGGSRLFYRNGMFVVGPQSAGAHPGPICYRKNGYLAVTDANLHLGRLLPQYFPKIFGPTENLPLDENATKEAFEKLTEEVNNWRRAQHEEEGGGAPHKTDFISLTSDEVAFGFVRVANEAMCRPIRTLTQMKGYDVTTHILACFGGAGAQHACAIANALGMKSVFVHRFSGILSAFGLGLANVVHEEQEAVSAVLDASHMDDLHNRLDILKTKCFEALQAQGFEPSTISILTYMNLRYRGTDTGIFTECPLDENNRRSANFQEAFVSNYKREFGFVLSRDIVVDDLRVRATAVAQTIKDYTIPEAKEAPKAVEITQTYFEAGRLPTNVYKLEHLFHGHTISGPAIIIDRNCTIVVEPSWEAFITHHGNVRLSRNVTAKPHETNAAETSKKPHETNVAEIATKPHETHENAGGEASISSVVAVADPIQLAIFAHRFMGIAEQMGRTLQRTSVSVNIKERLDFSCALFDSNGGLVANAPHIPVHLGAMQEAVRHQISHWGNDMHEGDVFVSNHPQLAGGSHLPDITVITPVFREGIPVFFVASRGHHADIGGISPGSMPPFSKLLIEEGAAIEAFKLVSNGEFQEEGISKLLTDVSDEARQMGSVGTRCLADNISDLKAQVAANHRGIVLMNELVDIFGLTTVQAYMQHIQHHAELSVREMLKRFARQQNKISNQNSNFCVASATDYMDDGTPICLTVTIDQNNGNALFDFSGTGPQVYGNCNAPAAVTLSAIIYCMRCLVGQDMPLNQGCMAPCTVKIPDLSILSPDPTVAVVGGNVLTSQRVTDVILSAFSAAAASQGCMNNFTFGSKNFGYYETIAGGAGAGPGWHGRSGVHTHMTNTRITDPEILEQRFPVFLKQFSLRENSGGKGRFVGGDGVIRHVVFLEPLTMGIVSERRSLCPPGIRGGGAGSRGVNLLIKRNGITYSLGSKASVPVEPGDSIKILTPGGGGYGNENDDTVSVSSSAEQTQTVPVMQSGSVLQRTLDQESA